MGGAINYGPIQGLDISTDTLSEVWGVAVDLCVADTAEMVNNHFKLDNYPIIPLKATEQQDIRKGEIAMLEANLKRRYPKAKVVDRL